jgi:hypothetical protein
MPSPRKSIWSQSIGDVIGKGVNHVVGTGRKACVRYVPCIYGGPGRNRTTDTRKPDPASRLLPAKIQFLMRSGAISQIEINEALIGNAHLFGY